MWSTTDFHRKSTVRGEADSWVHGGRKEVPPYYAENNDSSTDSWDPPDGPLYFVKKNVSPGLGPTSYIFARKEVRPGKKTIRPLTAGTHQLHLRRQGSA